MDWRVVPLLLCLFPSLAAAQEAFRAGQAVEVNVGGQWISGRVERVLPGGQTVQARVFVNGKPQWGVVPVDRVRQPGSAGQAGPAAAAVERTWTDSTGQFRIQATFAAQEGGTVKLRKPDGAEISVPVQRLSPQDQEYLASLQPAAKHPAGAAGYAVGDAVEVNWRSVRWYPAVIRQLEGDRALIHYEGWSDASDEWVNLSDVRRSADAVAADAAGTPRPDPASPDPAGRMTAGSVGETQPAAAADIPRVVCDVRAQAALPLDSNAPRPSRLPPDPGPTATMPEGHLTLTGLSTLGKPAGFVPADSGAGVLLVSVVRQAPSNPTTNFLWCDLKTGQTRGASAFAGIHPLLAGGGPARWLITAGTEHAPRWVVWEWPQPDQPPQPVYELAIETDYVSAFAKQISRAWIAGDQAILQTEGKRVILWDLRQRRIVASWEGYKAGLSPGGKHLAVQDDAGVALVDLGSLQQTGYWPLGRVSATSLEFSPQATSLACLLQSDLHVLDLQTGATRFANSLPPSAGAIAEGPPRWCNEDQVIVGRQHLVDLNAGFVVWRYTDRSGFSGVPEMLACGGKICYQIGDSLVSLTLPHQEVRAAIEGIEPREIYALEPGGTVSLQVDAGGDSPAIRQAVQQRIAENGWRLADSSPVRILVSTKAGESRNQTFTQGLAGTGPATTVTFRPTISEVDIQVNGQSAWRITTETTPPTLLTSLQGQSTQDALRAYEKPSVAFFRDLPLPRQIVKPQFQNGLGSTELTATGPAQDAGRNRNPVRPPARQRFER